MLTLIGNIYVDIVLDLLSVFLSFGIANYIRFDRIIWEGLTENAGTFLIVLVCSCLICNFLLLSDRKPNTRDFFARLRIVFIHNLCMFLFTVVFLFIMHIANKQSRLVVGYFFVINIILMLLEQMIYEYLLRRYFQNPEKCEVLVLVANEKNVLAELRRLADDSLFTYRVDTIVIAGKNGIDRFYTVTHKGDADGKIHDFLKDGVGNAMDYLTKTVVDDVVLSLPESDFIYVCDLLQTFEEMGVTTHLSIDTLHLERMPKEFGTFGFDNVLNFYERRFTFGERLLKRLMDIAVSLVGCLCCIVIGIFVCPAIWLEDPGPVIFKQKRVGRNGRFFYIYKFRSMYKDAEARKKELMQKNEMNGLMFKIKDDPRITRVGKIIRKTSLDEFPQFFNVLSGSMSIVGTRPPTVDEFEHYSAHHKRRLQLKPGITGLWQISGRSDITDFEEIVRFDCQYIDTQSIWLDIRILFMTIKAVLLCKGAG